MTQKQAWEVYYSWLDDDRVEFLVEPEADELGRLFEEFSTGARASTKLWADAYLAAFARAAGLTLVTFDRGFARMRSVEVRVLSPSAAV